MLAKVFLRADRRASYAQRTRGGLSKSPRDGHRKVSQTDGIPAPRKGGREEIGLAGNRQIGKGDESLWAASRGIAGSFWFLQRQEEQGRSPSAWTIARSCSRIAGILGLAVAISSDGSMRINSAFIAFLQSICLAEAPHRAEASETHPRKNARTITPRAIDRKRIW